IFSCRNASYLHKGAELIGRSRKVVPEPSSVDGHSAHVPLRHLPEPSNPQEDEIGERCRGKVSVADFVNGRMSKHPAVLPAELRGTFIAAPAAYRCDIFPFISQKASR